MAYKNKDDAKRWYSHNRLTEIEKARKNKAVYVRRNIDYVNTLKTAPCSDCDKVYPSYVMQFDHISDDKEGTICRMARTPVSILKLEQEIAKCELVCANCHAERTHQRNVV